MPSKTFNWTESFSASVEDDRLIALFAQHAPGKAAEALAEYLADVGPSDSDLWPILRAIREEAGNDTDDVNEITYSDD